MYMYMYMYMYVYVQVFAYVQAYVNVYVYVHVYVCVYIHMYIHTQFHTLLVYLHTLYTRSTWTGSISIPCIPCIPCRYYILVSFLLLSLLPMCTRSSSGGAASRTRAWWKSHFYYCPYYLCAHAVPAEVQQAGHAHDDSPVLACLLLPAVYFCLYLLPSLLPVFTTVLTTYACLLLPAVYFCLYFHFCVSVMCCDIKFDLYLYQCCDIFVSFSVVKWANYLQGKKFEFSIQKLSITFCTSVVTFSFHSVLWNFGFISFYPFPPPLVFIFSLFFFFSHRTATCKVGVLKVFWRWVVSRCF